MKSVKLDDDMHERLIKLAAKHDKGIREFVRFMIQHFETIDQSTINLPEKEIEQITRQEVDKDAQLEVITLLTQLREEVGNISNDVKRGFKLVTENQQDYTEAAKKGFHVIADSIKKSN